MESCKEAKRFFIDMYHILEGDFNLEIKNILRTIKIFLGSNLNYFIK